MKTKRAGKIKGEAVAPDHADDILVTSWNWGMSQGSAIGSGQATARRAYKHLSIAKRIDSASTALMSALATNDEVKEARLAMRKAGEEQEDFFSILLERGAGGRDRHRGGRARHAVERVSFAFTKVESGIPAPGNQRPGRRQQLVHGRIPAAVNPPWPQSTCATGSSRRCWTG